MCEDTLLYFNGSTALLVDLVTWREKARTSYRSSMDTSGGRGVHSHARIPLGGRTLELDGITYMH